MEQKVILLEESSLERLQQKIDGVRAEHKGWKVTSANTAATCEVYSMAHDGVHSRRGFVTTLVLEKEADDDDSGYSACPDSGV